MSFLPEQQMNYDEDSDLIYIYQLSPYIKPWLLFDVIIALAFRAYASNGTKVAIYHQKIAWLVKWILQIS